MKDENKSPAEILFIMNIVAVDILLISVAGLSAYVLGLSVDITLFSLGILVGGIGSYLGTPNRSASNYPQHYYSELENRPVRNHIDSLQHRANSTVPQYGFENVMVFAGLIAVVLSTPFLCQIMF